MEGRLCAGQRAHHRGSRSVLGWCTQNPNRTVAGLGQPLTRPQGYGRGARRGQACDSSPLGRCPWKHGSRFVQAAQCLRLDGQLSLSHLLWWPFSYPEERPACLAIQRQNSHRQECGHRVPSPGVTTRDRWVTLPWAHSRTGPRDGGGEGLWQPHSVGQASPLQ